MSLARSLRRTSLLVRLRRAQTAVVYAAGASGCALLWLDWRRALAACAFAGVGAALWPVDATRVARALDDANAMEGRLVAAHELARLPERTPFMEAALRDADARVLSSRGAVPHGPRWWWHGLALLPWLAWLSSTAPRDERVDRRAPVAEVSTAGTPAHTVASLDALQAHLNAREEARQRALDALRPVVRDARGEVTAGKLRALADAVAGGALSSEARTKLKEALERARESERARLDEARRDAQQREQERQLEQLKRPDSDERKLDQLTRPPPPSPSSSPSEGDEVEQSLSQAAAALQQGAREDAAQALRDGADALDQRTRQSEQQQRELDQLREQMRGGGSEPDPGGQDPGERRIGGRYQDERVRGDHGEGPSRSEVIEGASQRGFASASYRRVYGDYRAHAEQLLERDDVPASERFYVRRYFQLVQPREAP